MILSRENWEEIVRRARSEVGVKEDVWSAISAIAGCTESVWITAMTHYDGIEVLPGDISASARIESKLPSPDLISVEDAGQLWLVSTDPWSEDVLRHVASAPSATRLALAARGQLEKLMLRNGPSTMQVAVKGFIDGGEPSTIVSFVDEAILRARRESASDIHFEVDRAGVHVKYRIDGVMAAGSSLDGLERAEEVVSRIKVMAQLDITERRRPQDGRIHWPARDGDTALDLRVSIMPSIFGEDAVLRLLDKAQLETAHARLTLAHLGFEHQVAESLRELATRPHGMLLMTGPTGSGKTTTVYAALSEVNDGTEKIVTIEDPVEYELPGVLQIPVNEQKGLTFATGLRSILRHDPDKILVGEIRDPETAQIAVQSALTGHLVFTTVHANSLFDVLGRFAHFGIDAFALASALNGVVVQRLMRRACPECLEWRSLTSLEGERLARASVSLPQRVPAMKGCAACRGTGYRGRFVVAEVHVLTDRVRDLLISGASITALKQAVYETDAAKLLDLALRQVEVGRTSLEEVVRVVGLA